MAQTFFVDYYDCRVADSAFKALNNRNMLGARLTLVSKKSPLGPPIQLETKGASVSCICTLRVAGPDKPPYS